MIEMISGCTRIGSHVMTPADGPFITVKEIEEHLVGIGVARYLDAAASPLPAADEIGPEPSAGMGEDKEAAEGEQTAFARLDAEQLKTMKNLQLKKLAKDLGIDVKNLRTNAELIAAITAVDIEADDEEDAPALSAEDIVV